MAETPSDHSGVAEAGACGRLVGSKALTMFCKCSKSRAKLPSPATGCSPKPSWLLHPNLRARVGPQRMARGLRPVSTYTGGVDSGLR